MGMGGEVTFASVFPDEIDYITECSGIFSSYQDSAAGIIGDEKRASCQANKCAYYFIVVLGNGSNGQEYKNGDALRKIMLAYTDDRVIFANRRKELQGGLRQMMYF